MLQLRAFSFAKGGLVAAQEMHAALLHAVVRAPLSFFNRTPPGRILNRHASPARLLHLGQNLVDYFHETIMKAVAGRIVRLTCSPTFSIHKQSS